MDNRYDILESISQRENREMPEENGILVCIANDIRRAAAGCRGNEAKLEDSTFDVNKMKLIVIWQPWGL